MPYTGTRIPTYSLRSLTTALFRPYVPLAVDTLSRPFRSNACCNNRSTTNLTIRWETQPYAFVILFRTKAQAIIPTTSRTLANPSINLDFTARPDDVADNSGSRPSRQGIWYLNQNRPPRSSRGKAWITKLKEYITSFHRRNTESRYCIEILLWQYWQYRPFSFQVTATENHS